MPAKLSTRVRVLDTGHGSKNDPADAHAVGVAALRHRDLVEITVDDATAALCTAIGAETWCSTGPRR